LNVRVLGGILLLENRRVQKAGAPFAELTFVRVCVMQHRRVYWSGRIAHRGGHQQPNRVEAVYNLQFAGTIDPFE
jgi:hypothetical protein